MIVPACPCGGGWGLASQPCPLPAAVMSSLGHATSWAQGVEALPGDRNQAWGCLLPHGFWGGGDFLWQPMGAQEQLLPTTTAWHFARGRGQEPGLRGVEPLLF